MSDNPEALPQPKQYAPFYPAESRADQYAASRYVSGWNECHAAFTAALAQQAATPTRDPERREYDEAVEALRRALCALPRFSFLLDAASNVRRVPDKCGNWIDFTSAHELFDAVVVDALVARQAATPAPAEPLTPLCAVHGAIRPGAMCSKVIVGLKHCGHDGECEHKRVAPPATPAAQPADDARDAAMWRYWKPWLERRVDLSKYSPMEPMEGQG